MIFKTIRLHNLKKRATIGVLCAFIVGAAIYNNNNKSITTILPVENKVVIIDAGHGGFDPGKAGVTGENEKVINLKISEYLQQYLEQSGAVAIITRNTDEALGDSKKSDMSERKNIANTSEGDILISIHQNSFTSQSVHGSQVFYYKNSENGKKLADSIQDSLCTSLGSTRVAKSNTDYYVLRTTEIPAAIVECGFLSNYSEEQKLNEDEYQQETAWAIYKGITNYFDAE